MLRKNLLCMAIFIYSVLTMASVAYTAPAELPSTGQTICYNDSGSIIVCSGTGQDGDKQWGAAWPNPRFTVASSGTGTVVTDNLTGLVWAGDGGTPTFIGPVSTCTGGTMNWDAAFAYVACLNANTYLGYADWRLPNMNEMRSIANPSQANGAAWLNSQGFSNAQDGPSFYVKWYWSSTTNHYETDKAWVGNLNGHASFLGLKSLLLNVWPVRLGQCASLETQTICLPRSGQTTSYVAGDDGDLQVGVVWPEPRFTLISWASGTVIVDQLTGLMWPQDGNAPGPGQCAPGVWKSWQEALQYVACLNANNHLDYSDWRLPNVNELKSITHYGQSNPAAWLNTQGFENVQIGGTGYATSTTYGRDATLMWVVGLWSGGVGYGYKDVLMSPGYNVWPVRAGRSSSAIYLTISKSGAGSGQVNLDRGALIWSGGTGTASYGSAMTVNISASPDAGSSFDGWSGACSGIGTCQVTMNSVKNVVAVFVNTTWPLTVSVTGIGTVHTSPGTDLACTANCGTSYSDGTLVNLTVNPGTGYTFSGWSGDPDCTDGTVTMNAAKTCIASFAQSAYLVQPIAGSGGTITPNAIQTVSSGATTTFTVTPNTGYSIGNVTGCGGSLVGSTYTTGAITGACTVTASFTPIQYTVSTSAGTGGTITPTSRLVSHGSTTTFTVTPNTGYSIGLVSGCSGTLSGNTYTTGAITGACTVTATFSAFSAPTTPTLNSPASLSETTNRTPTLAVNASTDPNNDPITYTFEVSTTSNFSNIAASISGITASNGVASWAVTPELSDNTLYYWRSLATDGSLSSPWMPTANFFVNTVNDKPTDPAVNSPMNNVHVATLTPVLSVTNATDVDMYDTLTYDFDVAKDGGFTNIVASATGRSQGNGGITSWIVTPALTEDTPYYWRARARDNHGATSPNWISASFFVSTTNNAPTTPTLNAPVNTGDVALFAPTLTVNNATDPEQDSLHYVFEIDTVNTFNSPSKQTSGLLAEGANTTSWAPATLTENTTYYWRAKANDGLTDSPWMATASFFVNTVNEQPTAPTLNNPSNNGQVTVQKPTLQVNAAMDPDNDALTYEFEVYADSGLVTKITSAIGTGASWVVDSTLSDNTWYWWRARARDVHSLAGNWMAASSFFVNNNGFNDWPTITITKPGAAEPVFYGGIYTIQWTAADPDSSATITLGYDTTGATTCDGTQIATGITEHDGSDSYNWNITNLAQGTYYIYAKITDGTTTVCEYSASPLTKNNSSGDMNGDGIVDITDALWALRIAAGLIQPTPADIAHADVAPIVNGVPQADGVIDIRDVVVILRKAAGLVTW